MFLRRLLFGERDKACFFFLFLHFLLEHRLIEGHWSEWMQPSRLPSAESFLLSICHDGLMEKLFSQYLNRRRAALWNAVNPRYWAYSLGHDEISALLQF